MMSNVNGAAAAFLLFFVAKINKVFLFRDKADLDFHKIIELGRENCERPPSN